MIHSQGLINRRRETTTYVRDSGRHFPWKIQNEHNSLFVFSLNRAVLFIMLLRRTKGWRHSTRHSDLLTECGMTLLRSIIVFCGTDIILGNVRNIQEYFLEWCQSHKTMLWICIMLWAGSPISVTRLMGFHQTLGWTSTIINMSSQPELLMNKNNKKWNVCQG